MSRWARSEFIERVGARRGWDLKSAAHTWTLSGAENDLAWTCALTLRTDHTESGQTHTSIDWICPTLGVTEEQVRQVMSHVTVASMRSGRVGENLPPRFSASRGGPQTDLGTVIDALKRRSFAALFRAPSYHVDIDDPSAILDDELRWKIENWPPAFTGNSDAAPVRLGMIRDEPKGLRIVTEDWWDSEAALEHQIEIGIELAVRLDRARNT